MNNKKFRKLCLSNFILYWVLAIVYVVTHEPHGLGPPHGTMKEVAISFILLNSVLAMLTWLASTVTLAGFGLGWVIHDMFGSTADNMKSGMNTGQLVGGVIGSTIVWLSPSLVSIPVAIIQASVTYLVLRQPLSDSSTESKPDSTK